VLVDPTDHDDPARNWWAGRTVPPERVAAALERLYRRADERREWAAAAYRNATRPEYHWRHIAGRWDALFRRLLAGGEVGG
jgi:hypothetical protein